MWVDLEEEVAELFAIREGVYVRDIESTQLWDPEARAALELARRPYQAMKQKQYGRERREAERAARKCPACNALLGRPYACTAKCTGCGADCYVPPAKETLQRGLRELWKAVKAA